MTDRYAVFGNPIGHSKSPFIHRSFAAQFDDDMSYEAVEAPQDGFRSRLDQFISEGGRGINITVPFKTDAFAAADERCEGAALTGASNCLKFENGRIIAENFDGVGLLRDIADNLGQAVSGKRVLFLGAGGATRGAALPILRAGAAQVVVANRTVAKAQAIADELTRFGEIRATGYDSLSAGHDIVLNATSASLFDTRPQVADAVFEGTGLAYDLVYAKGLTGFLRQAQGMGVPVLADGVGMLVEQAAEAYAWWREQRPDTAALIRDLTVPLV
ncbi:shikimate dehydrogenase [Primorskyibacter flagellatus]|uniref:Shikimate dehydrogenase (NADP(+)) n=1 Tax=Primorskyibacter flagellatus TaxID=1387277 RepID=A0A1W2CN60_9RHOB|nr:shikimate dehydrogenase [Primorskyibacter flagellatus]SMC86048.1 shikimate dehydrogenase [Primorskyibacter flagellatus]